MTRFLQVFASGLLLTFMACCIASAALQVMAWTRHAREGVRVDLRGLWKPEGYFDETGMHQMRIARWALLIGGVMYLSYGVLAILAGAMAGR